MRLQAQPGQAISLQFDGDFGLYCEYNACFHWVEVKYANDLGIEGPRYVSSSSIPQHREVINFRNNNLTTCLQCLVYLFDLRFCGVSRPSAVITSESSEMMVTMRTNYSGLRMYQRGFKANITSGKQTAAVDLRKIPDQTLICMYTWRKLHVSMSQNMHCC